MAPKEDLTSDEERGSSEEEDGAPRDPSLTHKVGLPTPGRGPVGGGRPRCEGGERLHSFPSPCGGSCFQTADAKVDAEAESQGGWGCGLKARGRHGGADAAGVTADILLGPRKRGDEAE